jgi:hypothetical protein
LEIASFFHLQLREGVRSKKNVKGSDDGMTFRISGFLEIVLLPGILNSRKQNLRDLVPRLDLCKNLSLPILV